MRDESQLTTERARGGISSNVCTARKQAVTVEAE